MGMEGRALGWPGSEGRGKDVLVGGGGKTW